MKTILRGLLGLGGLVLAFMAFGFLTDPVTSAANFGIAAEGVHAITSIRADMTAFFGVSAACFLWGAWKQESTPLAIGGALMLVALAARIVSLAVNGSFEGFIQPMAFEAVFGALALIGAKTLPQRA